MSCHWVAVLNDGSVVSELQGVSWASVADNVQGLSMEDGEKTLVELPRNQKRYVQGKTGSCSLAGSQMQIESRWIGFEDDKGNVLITRIFESDGKISVENRG